MMTFGLIFLFLLPFLMGSFLSFDEIIKIQYRDFKSEWEADGRPNGFFYYPENNNKKQDLMGYAYTRLSFIWLFRIPDWAKDNKTIKKQFIRFRLFVLCWNVGMVLNAIFFFKSIL